MVSSSRLLGGKTWTSLERTQAFLLLLFFCNHLLLPRASTTARPTTHMVQATTASSGILYVAPASAACGSILLYDAILTLDLEIEFVWRQQWNTSRILYLLCRYLFTVILLINAYIYSFMVDPPQRMCYIWQNIWVDAACVLAAAIPDSLILTRLDVLYRTKPKIRCLTLGIFCVHVSSLVAVAVMNNNLEPRAPIAKVVPTGCNFYMTSRESREQDLIVLIPVLSQVYYFAITAARFLDEVKEIRRETNEFVTRSIFSTMKRDLPIHSVLLRQGACYFFGTSVAYVILITADFISHAQNFWMPLTSLWITMNALLGSRLYLSMRSHGLARNNGNTTRMRAISLELEYKEYKDEEYKDSVQRTGLRFTQA